MPASRYFANDLSEDVVSLDEKEFHHLKNVMRGAPGDEIELIDGKGTLAFGKILALQKHHAEIKIERREIALPPTREVILAIAHMRPDRFSLILEKGTELGVTRFVLFPGDASEVKNVSLTRAEQLIISATKQCGRLFLPKLEEKPPLAKWEKQDYPLYFGDIRKGAKPVPKLSTSVQIVIGPESGFSTNEVKKLETLGEGVTLSENILRSETAAIVAVVLFM